jgi:hypothetical protein
LGSPSPKINTAAIPQQDDEFGFNRHEPPKSGIQRGEEVPQLPPIQR